MIYLLMTIQRRCQRCQLQVTLLECSEQQLATLLADSQRANHRTADAYDELLVRVINMLRSCRKQDKTRSVPVSL